MGVSVASFLDKWDEDIRKNIAEKKQRLVDALWLPIGGRVWASQGNVASEESGANPNTDEPKDEPEQRKTPFWKVW